MCYLEHGCRSILLIKRHRFCGEKRFGNDSKEEINLRNSVIGSKDVKKLYTPIDIDITVKKFVEMIVKKKSTLGTW